MRSAKTSRKVAFGGIVSALSLLCMFLSGVFPFAEYTCPAAAGIVLVALVIDFGKRVAFAAYGGVALLSLIITPNKEAALLFVLFLGYYPIVKGIFEQTRSRVTEWVLKLVLFNAMIVAAYWLLLNLLGMTGLFEQLTIGGVQLAMEATLAVLLLLGNVTFVLYDLALSRLIMVYCQLLRPKLRRLLP